MNRRQKIKKLKQENRYLKNLLPKYAFDKYPIHKISHPIVTLKYAIALTDNELEDNEIFERIKKKAASEFGEKVLQYSQCEYEKYCEPGLNGVYRIKVGVVDWNNS